MDIEDEQIFPEADPTQPGKEGAIELLAQVRYLLDDEVGFGTKLAEDRKTKLSLLALIVGLGLFNVGDIKPVVEGIEHSPILLSIFTWSLVIGTSSMIVALYMIALERDPTPTTKMIIWIWRRSTGLLLKLLCKVTGYEITKNEEDEDIDPRKRFQAALVVLFGDRSETNHLGLDLEWLSLRIEESRLAYLRLAFANRRIRKRLERGTFALLVAFVSVIMVIGVVAQGALYAPAETADSHLEKEVQNESGDAESKISEDSNERTPQ